MPIHDWTRVDPGIFHAFHLGWIAEIQRTLNGGLLPEPYYALAEQIVGGPEPDVVALQATYTKGVNGSPSYSKDEGGIALATAAPKVWLRRRMEVDIYTDKANGITIRHRSNHRVVALIEIVSPGNKSSRDAIETFVKKAVHFIRGGIHQLIVDLFPPGPRDPHGIHKLIWDKLYEEEFALPPERPLTLVSYIGGVPREALVEPAAIGSPLPEMPLYLTHEGYIWTPLESTYQAAWSAVPAFWRDVLSRDSDGQ